MKRNPLFSSGKARSPIARSAIFIFLVVFVVGWKFCLMLRAESCIFVARCGRHCVRFPALALGLSNFFASVCFSFFGLAVILSCLP